MGSISRFKRRITSAGVAAGPTSALSATNPRPMDSVSRSATRREARSPGMPGPWSQMNRTGFAGQFRARAGVTAKTRAGRIGVPRARIALLRNRMPVWHKIVRR